MDVNSGETKTFPLKDIGRELHQYINDTNLFDYDEWVSFNPIKYFSNINFIEYCIECKRLDCVCALKGAGP